MKLTVKVHPNSKQEKIEGPPYEVWTRQKPLKGKANKAVMKTLSEYFKISTSKISLVSGDNSRFKIFEVDI